MYKIDIDLLLSTIDGKRKKEGLSWRGLAKEMGVSPGGFNYMRRGGRPTADNFVILLKWTGLPLDIFIIEV